MAYDPNSEYAVKLYNVRNARDIPELYEAYTTLAKARLEARKLKYWEIWQGHDMLEMSANQPT
jgi:hypothetical protein